MADHPALVAAQRGLASLSMALVLTQFFLAGAGAFGATSFDAHRSVGSVLVVVVLLGLLVAALVRRHVAHAAIFLGVTVLQLVLGTLGSDEPWVGALHGLNAIAVLGAGGTLAQKAWGRGSAAPDARPA